MEIEPNKALRNVSEVDGVVLFDMLMTVLTPEQVNHLKRCCARAVLLNPSLFLPPQSPQPQPPHLRLTA